MKKTLQIDGMTCASCVQTVDKGVAALNGVNAVSVNLQTETLTVSFDETLVRLADIIQAVESKGYQAYEHKTHYTFNVAGMTCATCVQNVEKAVKPLAGVSDVTVNLATEQLTVNTGDAVSTDAIIAAVKAAGYDAQIRQVNATEESLKEKRKRHLATMWHRFFYSALVTVPLFYLSMGHMIGLPIPNFLDPSVYPVRFSVVQLILTVPVILLGRPFYRVGF